MTFLKYYNPPNYDYPDEVSVVNVTDIEFRPVNRHGLVESSGTGKFVSRLLGSIRVPMDSGKRNLPTERLSACVDYASMSLLASHSFNGPLDLIQVRFLRIGIYRMLVKTCYRMISYLFETSMFRCSTRAE